MPTWPPARPVRDRRVLLQAGCSTGAGSRLHHRSDARGSFIAARGEGAQLKASNDTTPLKASFTAEVADAVVCTGFPYGDRDKLPRMIAAFGKFTEMARGLRRMLQILGSVALSTKRRLTRRIGEQAARALDVDPLFFRNAKGAWQSISNEGNT